MPRLSPLPTSLLPPRWQLESAEKLHLVLELDAELLVRPPPRLCHQGDGLGRAGAVRAEHVRAEADRRHREPAARGPRQRLLELRDRLRPREGPRGATGPERGETRERDAFLDLHASSSRIMRPARSTSPAPIVRTRSPRRARRERKRAASSREGVHATGMPGRAAASASTTSLPSTPATGSSRAA